MKTIYVDGGSTAYGMFDAERGGWAARLHLQTMMDNASHMTNPTVVTNRAMPGRTLGAVLRGFSNDTVPYLRQGGVTAVVQVGLNEAKIFPGSDRPIVDIEKFGSQLMQLSGTTYDKGIRTILVGPQPIDETLARSNPTGSIMEDDLIEAYGEVMRQTAEAEGMAYVDTRTLFADHSLGEVLAPDGYHPNALGHTMLFQAISDVL